jgi:hypothetical protein
MGFAAGLGLVAACLAAAGEAHAAPDAEPAWEKAPAVRRSGFVAGLSIGLLGAGSFAGYPNDVRKIGYERYYTETGLATGSSAELWIGGALSDWCTFGVGFGMLGIAPDGLTAGGGTFTFRVETFPFFGRGGRAQDFGLLLLAGTGGVAVTPEDDEDTKLIDGGAASRVGVGLFYEGARPWKFGMGPFASFDYLGSDTVRAPMVVVGFRSAIYTGN